MSGRNRQGDWGEFSDRARQPLGPGAGGRRRGRGQQRQSGAGSGYPQNHPGLATRGAYQQRGSGVPQPRFDQRDNGGRSRFVAVIVLMVAAVIVIIGGIAASQGASSTGSGATVSISLLPFPQNTVTTAPQ